jgi:Protein of unknown function (DUF1064)
MAFSKYKNIKTVVDGIKFDSAKEAKRYSELKILQSQGIISCLELQKRFELIPKQILKNGKTEHSLNYVADYVYIENGKQYVVDVKSEITRKNPLYIAKRKLMKFIHDIEIYEF